MCLCLGHRRRSMPLFQLYIAPTAAVGPGATADMIEGGVNSQPGAVLRNQRGPEWGDRAVWEDLHHKDPYPFWLD